tara:strand:+ start:2611 stop:3663 length:1053 start_codon:yes stop_codon:yes gene_type:complete
MEKIILSIAFLVASINTIGQVGLDTSDLTVSSRVEISSTIKGHLLSRMTQVQIDAIVSPAAGLMVYCADEKVKGVYLFNGNIFLNVSSGLSFEATGVSAIVTKSSNPAAADALSLSDLTSVGVVDVRNYQTLYEEAITGASSAPTTLAALQTIIDRVNTAGTPTVTAASGAIWMDRNLGATQAAKSTTDRASYGGYYQWGRASDGHQVLSNTTTRATSATDIPDHGDFITGNDDWRANQNDDLWQGVAGTNNPCPSGFRIPTEEEWKTEFAAESISSAATAFSSTLKLSLSGYRSNGITSHLNNLGSYGMYWSSSVKGIRSHFIYFYASITDLTNDGSRAIGMSVRCIKN